MRLISLEADSVRNLNNVEIEASPGLNVITGVNGSGKSSFIESIHLLGRGRSFRTRKVSEVVQKSKKSMFVAADIHSNTRSDNPVRVGMERIDDKTRYRFSGREVKAVSELVAELPLVFISPDDHHLLEGAPARRRRWADMNVFHMKQQHLQNCKEYNKSLRHRNALLRAGCGDPRQFETWERAMAELSEIITAAREEYLAKMEHEIAALLKEFKLDGSFSMVLKNGWKKGIDFAESLVKYRDRDLRMQYTCDGPHAADIRFFIDGSDARSYLSRGRQKILFIALSVATAKILSGKREPPVILVDDLVAELDQHNTGRTLSIISGIGCQAWVTATDIGDDVLGDGWAARRRFHVEQGKVHQV